MSAMSDQPHAGEAPPVSLPVYILAGGRSRRFGSDKARAELGGVPLVRRVADELAPIASRIVVVADVADKYADLGLPTIADEVPDRGPLGGLATALADLAQQEHQPANEQWLLLTSCDLVQVEPAWVRQLWAACAPGAQAVAFRSERWQPLLALYHREIEPAVRHHLREDRRAMWQLLEAVQVVAVAPPVDWPAQVQVNSPAELAQVRRRQRRQRGQHGQTGGM